MQLASPFANQSGVSLETLLSVAANHSARYMFTVSLEGASPGAATAVVTYSDDTQTLHVRLDFDGLLGKVLYAHLHCCATGPGNGDASQSISITTLPEFPLGVRSGSYECEINLADRFTYHPTFLWLNGESVRSASDALLDALLSGRVYLDIHTTTRPKGELYGFLAFELPGHGCFHPEERELSLAA